MESKRRVSVTNGEDEDSVESAKVSGMKLPDRGILKSILKEGRSRYAALDFEGASEIFQRAWDIALQQQASGAAMVQIANNVSACMLQQRDFQGVLHWTNRALEADGQNQKALLQQWLALSELGETTEAVKSLAVIERAPLEGTKLGNLQLQKAIVAADSEKERALRCTNLRKEGNDLMKAGQKELAIGKYTAALEEDPKNTAALNNRAQANLDLQRFEEAEKDATDALRSDPDNLKASYRRGRARFLRDQPDRRGACMDLTRVVSKDPTNEQAKSLLRQVVSSLELDGHADGEGTPNRLRRGSFSSRHLKDGSVHGHVSFVDGTEPGDEVPTDEERAARDKEVQAQHPDTAKTHWPDAKTRPGLMIVEDEAEEGGQGDCTSCPGEEDKGAEDDAAGANGWRQAEELRARGDLDGALEMYTGAAAARPSDLRCWIGLARVYRKLGKLHESLEAASRAVAIDSSNRVGFLCSELASLGLAADKETPEQRQLRISVIRTKLADMVPPQERQGDDELQELDALAQGLDNKEY